MELNKVTLASTIGEIKRSFNDGVLDAFGEVAAALKAEAANGGNALIDQALEQCKKTQDMYNTCLGSVDGFLKDCTEVAAIAEYLEKQADIGAVKTRDTSFKNQGIDSSEVVM